MSPKTRWEVKERLKFIEVCLFWRGRVTRGNLMSAFGISGAQATTDLTRYQELAPQNMIYDTSEKAYLSASDFEPVLTSPVIDDLQETVRALRNIEGTKEPLVAETLPLLQRNIDRPTLQAVLRAVQDRKSIEVRYQSMSNPDPGWRWISPHALAHDGKRWHVRAYCYANNDFRDFLFARILEVRDSRRSIMFSIDDHEWHQFDTIEIVPHPGLSDGQKQVIELDYGMTDGVLQVNVRKALRRYFEQQYNLLEPHDEPAKQQIVMSTVG